jgi:hypothetical protein
MKKRRMKSRLESMKASIHFLRRQINCQDCIIAENEELIVALEDELYPVACKETRDAIDGARHSRLSDKAAS